MWFGVIEEFIEINLISSVSQVFALVLPFPEILMLGAKRERGELKTEMEEKNQHLALI